MSKINNIEFKSCSKEKLIEDPLYKFRIYFSRKNNQRAIIENLSTSKVQLKDSLMYFDKENIDITNDRFEISFVLIKDTIKRYKPLIVQVSSLCVGIEKEEIWTLSSQSLINLTYNIETETQRKQVLETEAEVKTIIDCSKKEEQDDFSPMNIRYKKTISENNILEMLSKDTVVTQESQNKTPIPLRVNTFLKGLGRNNSPKLEKSNTYFTNDKTEKKFEVSSSLFQKSFQMNNAYQNNSQNNINNTTVINGEEFEIVESKDISLFDNINEKSPFGNRTTNNSSNPGENYETFAQAVFVSGLSVDSKLEKIIGSEDFIAPCGHVECSFLPAYMPKILHSYINQTAQTKPDINNLVSNIGFPLGIKFCYYCIIDRNKNMNNTPKPQQNFANVIKNEKNEFYYISTLQYFIKMSIKDFESLYQINPLKEYVNNNNIGNSSKNVNRKDEKTQEKIQLLSELMINDNILIPESISLVSKYPYFTSMDTCLKTIISLPKDEINPLISHIINEVPVPPKDQLVLFYVPRTSQAVKIYSPILSENDSISLLSNKFLLDYFSIESICLIFELILLEQKVLFVHNNYQELSKISFLFTNLIYPFSWVNPYIPVLNLTTVQFLQSFIPYIMGIDEYLLKYADKNHFLTQGEVVIIQISKDSFILNKNRRKISKKNLLKELGLPELPEKVMSFLVAELKLIKKSSIIDTTVINSKIKELFIKVMIMLIGDFKSFTFMVNEDMPLFNKEAFVNNHQTRDMKAFLSELTNTQIFNQFLFNEKQLFNNQENTYCDNNLPSTIGENGPMSNFDTSYFMKMIPKYQGLINLQQVRKRSSSVSNRRDQNKSRDKSIPNHINSSFHNSPAKENSRNNLNILTTNDKDSINYNNEQTRIKNHLLLPYFISYPILTFDKQKIEDYIQTILKKKMINDINSVEQHCFIISNKKGYQFNKIISKKRYFINSISSTGINKDLNKSNLSRSPATSPIYRDKREEVKASLFSIEMFTQSKFSSLKKSGKQKDLDKSDIDDQTLPPNNKSLLEDCFKSICTSKKTLTNSQLEQLNQVLQNPTGREYLTKLIFPEETIANEENHKQLTIPSYEDLLYLIKISIRHTKNPKEYYTGRILTLACFSYYKIDKNNKVRYIYEDIINEQYQNYLWTQEDFWSFFCKDEIKSIQQNDESDLEEKILTVADIMIRLKLNKNFIKKIIIEQNCEKIFRKVIVVRIENKLFN